MPRLYLRRLRGWRFLLFNGVLGLAHLAVLFHAGAYIAFLPHVAGSLGGVKPSFGSWAQTHFMVALALGLPLARWLSCRFGRVRVFVGAFLVCAAASYVCARSHSLDVFLAARVVLGLAGGVTLPLAQTLLLDEYPDRLKPLGLTIWSLFTLMPFTLGLAFGGWVADEWGWRTFFDANVPVSLAIAGLMGALLYRRGYVPRCERFDLVGFVLLALVLGGIQTILNLGNDFDWFDSLFLRGVLVVVLVALPCWIVWELDEPQPAVDLRLFRRRSFAVGLLGLTAGFFTLQGLLSLFIVQLQVLLGYSSFLAGMVFLPILLLAAPTIAVMHHVAKWVDARVLATLSLLGLAGTYYWIGLYDDPHSYDQVLWPMIAEGLFLGAFFTPLTMLTLQGLTGEEMLRAAETANLFRITAGAMGIAAEGVVQFRRTPFHQLHLADHFGGRVSISYDVLAELTNRLEANGLDPAVIPSVLERLMKQYAGLLGLNDAFLLAAYGCVGLAVLVWLAGGPKRPVSKEPAEDRRRQQMLELVEEG